MQGTFQVIKVQILHSQKQTPGRYLVIFFYYIDVVRAIFRLHLIINRHYKVQSNPKLYRANLYSRSAYRGLLCTL
jgi:hypothetical protein